MQSLLCIDHIVSGIVKSTREQKKIPAEIDILPAFQHL